MQQTQPMGESLWYRYPYFLPYIGAFFFIFQFRGTSLHSKFIEFPINIPWLGKMQQIASYEENLENW